MIRDQIEETFKLHTFLAAAASAAARFLKLIV